MKGRKWVALCFLCVIAVFFTVNVHLIAKPTEGYFAEEKGFSGFRDEIQEELKSDRFSFKNQFINFNGWFSRLLGKRTINGVVLADNGMLINNGFQTLKIETGLHGQRIAKLNTALEQMGIPFIYVQAPSKVDLEKKILPVGVENYYNENADSFLAELAARDVRTIDLRPEFCATIEDVEEYFYKTDHHWNYRAAFKAFQILVPVIQNTLDDKSDVTMYTDEKNWESHILYNSYLGSWGKRVGLYVTDLDDFEYFTPRFETDMTIQHVQEGEWIRGDFEKCIIQKHILNSYKEYFTQDIYGTYIGSDLGLVEHKNKKPAVNKKIMLIKDSFVRPVQSFLSTVFEEVDVVDLRHYAEMSLIEYIYGTRPDMVIMLNYPGVIRLVRDYNLGYEGYEELVNDVAVFNQEALMTYEKTEFVQGDNPYLNISIYDEFENATAYTLEFDKLTVMQGDVDSVTVKLYDKEMEKALMSRIFEVEEGNAEGGFKWLFKTPDTDCSNVQLQLYCGMPGQTQDKAVVYENVALYKGWDISQN